MEKKSKQAGKTVSRRNPKEAGHDRTATEKAILAAVGDIVRERGFLGLGVNAVAEKAGASKVLIYRYFGDFDGLVAAWALENNYWGGVSVKDAGLGDEGLSGLAEKIFSGQIRSLRTSKESREILRWFLMEENPLGSRVMAMLETRGKETMEAALKAAGRKPNKRLSAGIAVITAGIYYLALIADRAPVFNGIDLGSDAEWKRVGETARDMALGLLSERKADGADTGKEKGGE
jgi:hypothetical protein